MYRLQDLSRRQPELLDKGVHGYKGNPHDFEPHRSRSYDMYARGGPEGVGGGSHRPMAAPPPAHSHHPSSSVAQPEALSMKNPRRPDSRNKSPSVYQGDPRGGGGGGGGGGGPPCGSPFAGMDPGARGSPAARIPPPPPLITSGGAKTPPKMSRSPPSSSSSSAASLSLGQQQQQQQQQQHGHMMVPPGSITHGTPVSHSQVAPPSASGHPPGAMGRRMEAMPLHQSASSSSAAAAAVGARATPPTSSSSSSSSIPPSARMEGSITKGTPMQGRGGGGGEGGRLVMDPAYQGQEGV